MASRVEGLERLKARFAKIPPAMRDEVRIAIEKGADELVEMQKRLAPVESGELRDSIRKRDGGHGLSVEVFTDDFKARWVEFGTSAHVAGGEFSGAQIPSIPARPFFFPAYRALRKRIKSRITRAVSKAVKRR